MNEPEMFQAELRRLKPAPPPDEFMARLEREVSAAPSSPQIGLAALAGLHGGWRLWGWLGFGAAGAVLVALLVWRPTEPATRLAPEHSVAPPVHQVTADDIAIGRRLLGSYDAVAELPDGAQVRFRCREWVDEVVWRDSTRGLVVEQQTPRLEVIPVRLEVY